MSVGARRLAFRSGSQQTLCGADKKEAEVYYLKL